MPDGGLGHISNALGTAGDELPLPLGEEIGLQVLTSRGLNFGSWTIEGTWLRRPVVSSNSLGTGGDKVPLALGEEMGLQDTRMSWALNCGTGPAIGTWPVPSASCRLGILCTCVFRGLTGHPSP